MDQDDDLERARTEAISLIMKEDVADPVELAEQLLRNPWFSTLNDFFKAVRTHQEAAKYAPQGSYPRAESEQEILNQLARIRKNKAFF